MNELRVSQCKSSTSHRFDKLRDKLDRGVGEITIVRAYLPSLEPEVSPALLRTAMKIWDKKIMRYIEV